MISPPATGRGEKCVGERFQASARQNGSHGIKGVRPPRRTVESDYGAFGRKDAIHASHLANTKPARPTRTLRTVPQIISTTVTSTGQSLTVARLVRS